MDREREMQKTATDACWNRLALIESEGGVEPVCALCVDTRIEEQACCEAP